MACFIVPTTEAIVTTIVKKSTDKKETHNPFLKRLNWLNNMTNAATPESTAMMLREMATSGVGMALLVTAVWAGIVAVTGAIAKRPASGELQVQTK